MSRRLNIPTVRLDFLKVTGFEIDVVGSSLEGGRNMLGDTISIGMTGGGMVTAAYDFLVHSPEQHEMINMLAARLNGSYRFINVPIRSDFAGPFPTINGKKSPFIEDIPHSDGAMFSDDTGYSQGTVWGRFAYPADLNAGVIQIDVFGAERRLRWSDWFSVYHHLDKGWRAYRYWNASDPEPVVATIGGTEHAGSRYSLAIDPPLRAETALHRPIEFARPRFVGKFPVDFTLPWRADINHVDRQTMKFIEAM